MPPRRATVQKVNPPTIGRFCFFFFMRHDLHYSFAADCRRVRRYVCIAPVSPHQWSPQVTFFGSMKYGFPFHTSTPTNWPPAASVLTRFNGAIQQQNVNLLHVHVVGTPAGIHRGGQRPGDEGCELRSSWWLRTATAPPGSTWNDWSQGGVRWSCTPARIQDIVTSRMASATTIRKSAIMVQVQRPQAY